jgi:hypothetical protein
MEIDVRRELFIDALHPHLNPALSDVEESNQ